MKIRAAVLEEFGEPLRVQEVDLADPGPGEVLVRLVACGVCHTDLYTASGAERIICVDLSEDRLELARGQGATDTWIADDNTVQRVLDETRGFGADYTFEATGNVKVMRQAVESARMGWGLATMCGVAGKGETLDVVPRFLITGRRVTGSSFGGVKGRTQVPLLVERWMAGEVNVPSLVS